jgi:hypothetical protein
MNAPTIWIVFPLAVGILLLFPNNQRLLSFIGGIVAVLLATAAQFVPLEFAMNLGSMSLKIDPTGGGHAVGFDLRRGGIMVLWRGSLEIGDAPCSDWVHDYCLASGIDRR